VLSSNAGGLTEINRHGITGFMAPVGDVQLLAEMGTNVLMNDKTLNEMKRAASNHAAQFDIHHIVPQYENLYRQFVKE
ncbi:MAG: N-acetyl-alpha-D-glucosaminyl L-malate synthase BshA, partial [Bacteroidota bacterium]